MYMEVLRYHNTALIRLIDMTKAVHKEWTADPDLAKIVLSWNDVYLL